MAKLVVYGDDREHCLARLRRALDESIIEPMPTSLDLHRRLVQDEDIISGNYTIRWLEEEFFNKDKD